MADQDASARSDLDALIEPTLRGISYPMSSNCQFRPVTSHQAPANGTRLNIACSATSTPAREVVLDEHTYAPGIKVSDEELATLAIELDGFDGEWDYRLRPRDLQV